LIKTAFLYFLVFFLWFVMFSPWTAAYVNFWLLMSLTAISLISITLIIQRDKFSEIFTYRRVYILIGLFSAFVLYLVFVLGNFFSNLIFSFAQSQVKSIYQLKSQTTPFVLAPLMILIGGAEEVFWRGYVQYTAARRLGPVIGYITASVLYALIHIWSFNFMLIMASLVCGLFWGLLYLKYRSLWPSIISHIVWDLFIFVLLPIH